MRGRYKVAMVAATVGILASVGLTHAFADPPVHYPVLLQNAHTGSCLDYNPNGALAASSVPAITWGCHGATNQAFNTDTFVRISAIDQGRNKCLGIEGDVFYPGNGTRLSFRACNNLDTGQQWTTRMVQLPSGETAKVFVNNGASARTGVEMVLDQDFTDPAGQRLHLWQFLNNGNQMWIERRSGYASGSCNPSPTCFH